MKKQSTSSSTNADLEILLDLFNSVPGGCELLLSDLQELQNVTLAAVNANETGACQLWKTENRLQLHPDAVDIFYFLNFS